jgi:outer membrane protein TolC
MGRTLATFTQLVQQEIDAWSRYRRALRREDQQALDALFAAARRHASAGAYLARDTPFEVMLISMLLEQHKDVTTLQQKVTILEARLLDNQTPGVAS